MIYRPGVLIYAFKLLENCIGKGQTKDVLIFKTRKCLLHGRILFEKELQKQRNISDCLYIQKYIIVFSGCS